MKLPTAPRDAAFNSRRQSRAMIDGVERKNAIPRFLTKKFPALYDQRQKKSNAVRVIFNFFRVLLVSLADFLPKC